MIQATVIQDSVNGNGTRLTTFEVELPRFILAEFNTHRQLSRNAQSSRAVPVNRLLELVSTDPVLPSYWGKNQAGMQADQELTGEDLAHAKQTWLAARDSAVAYSKQLHELETHKQLANRVTECFQWTKLVVTATNWDNFFKLRTHATTQPEFRELADKMLAAYNTSKPEIVLVQEWHVPYVFRLRDELGVLRYYVDDQEVQLPLALRLSSSMVAQVSYRKLDHSIDKANKIWQQLVESDPPHLSPVEHQATPVSLAISKPNNPDTWQPGITHQDRWGGLWSANFYNWIQHRQLL